MRQKEFIVNNFEMRAKAYIGTRAKARREE